MKDAFTIALIDQDVRRRAAISHALSDAGNQTLVSRLNNKARDAIVLVMQRLHQDDLAGHVRSIDTWDILTLPAIATQTEEIATGPKSSILRQEGDLLCPERESLDVLMQLRASMGSYAFSAQYQQQPIPPDSAIVNWDWFKRYTSIPADAKIIQSWDCASKETEFSDYNVCTTWAVNGSDAYLIDLFRKKLDFPSLVVQAAQLADRFRPSEVLIEDTSAGTGLIQSLRFHGPARMPRPKAIRPKGDKVTRLHVVSAMVERGQVHLPDQAAWLPALKDELVQFPFGKYDDQVDSISQFLAWFEKTTTQKCRAESVPMFFKDNYPRRKW